MLLPPLVPANEVEFDNTEDVTLTIDGFDLFEMVIKANSMTRADGSVPSEAE